MKNTAKLCHCAAGCARPCAAWGHLRLLAGGAPRRGNAPGGDGRPDHRAADHGEDPGFRWIMTAHGGGLPLAQRGRVLCMVVIMSAVFDHVVVWWLDGVSCANVVSGGGQCHAESPIGARPRCPSLAKSSSARNRPLGGTTQCDDGCRYPMVGVVSSVFTTS